MKAVCKKLFSLMLVAILLVSAVPFQVSADETEIESTTKPTTETVVETTEAVVETTEAVVETTEAVVDTTEAPVVPVMDPPMLFSANPMPTGEIFVYYQLEDGTQVGETVTAAMSQRVSSVPSATLAMETYARVHGNSTGMAFVQWYYIDINGNRQVFNKNLYINDSMAFENGNELNVYAQIEAAAKKISLKAAGGSLTTNSHMVKIGQTYNALGTLPTPVAPQHKQFLYWAKESNNAPINGDDIVTDFSNLTAVYATKKYDVIFQANNGTTWVNVGAFTFTGNYAVDANKTLKVVDGNFPNDAQIKSLFALNGWEISGWEYTIDAYETWNEFKVGSTKIASNTIIRPVYKKNITLYACDAGNTTRSLQVTLGKNFPILPHPGTRENYAFVGWYMEAAAQNLVSSKDNLSNVSAHPIVQSDVQALYAGWDQAKIVYLYIHTNGNTKEHTKLVRYYDVPVSGFDLTDIDLYDIFPNYGNYDDKNDEKWGWYNEAQWENFCMNKHKYETTEYVDADYLANDDVHEFYIMLINNGTTSNNNNYNDNSSTVDSSNPTTGDDIFVAVTVMAVSACAVLLIFMNKKRFTK